MNTVNIYGLSTLYTSKFANRQQEEDSFVLMNSIYSVAGPWKVYLSCIKMTPL